MAVVPPPIDLHWTNAATSRAAIGARFDRLLTVIFDAIAYRGADAIIFRLES